MKAFKIILVLGIALANSFTFAQTKKELLNQVEAQNKTIDSLNAVIENLDNIVETRDRTIKFLREDKTNLNTTIESLNQKIDAKNSEIFRLSKQAATGVGKMKLVNNKRPILKVPEGKYWVINQFIADYITDVSKDSLGIYSGEEVHVFVKSINDDILTKPSEGVFGPQVYSSINSNHTIPFPMILTENTKLTLIVMKGSFGSMTEYPGNVYCSLTEKDNY